MKIYKPNGVIAICGITRAIDGIVLLITLGSVESELTLAFVKWASNDGELK